MIEQELSGRMADAARDVPPGFDPDHVVDTIVRRQRRRRASVATGAATAVAVGAVTAAVLSAHAGTGATAGPAARPASSTVAVQAPASPAQVLRHLESVGDDVLAEHVPGVRFTLNGHWFGMNDDGTFDPKRPDAQGVYRVTERTGVTLGVYHAAKHLDLGYNPTGDPAVKPVSQRPGPNGSVLRVYRYQQPVGDGQQAYFQLVAVYRTDGVVATATATDRLPAAGTPSFPVGTDRLGAVAEDPRLTL